MSEGDIGRYIQAARAAWTVPCADCGAPAEEVLRGRGKSTSLCAEHLARRFAAAFRELAGPVVVYHPREEIRYERSAFSFVEVVEPELRAALGTLPAACGTCGRAGFVLYVGHDDPVPVPAWHDVPWVRSGDGETMFAVLCRECALGLLLPALPGRFDAVDQPVGPYHALVERSI